MLVPCEDPSAERQSTGEKPATDLERGEQHSTWEAGYFKGLSPYLNLLLPLVAEGVPPVLALLLVNSNGLLVLLATGALARVVATRRRDLVGLLSVLLVLLLPTFVVGDAAPKCGGDGRCPVGLLSCG